MMRRQERRGGRPFGFRRQGFGCLAGIVFLVVVASILAALASLISQLGPLQFIVIAMVAIGVLVALLRGLFLAGRDLDRLLGATRRVEDGDYAVRLGKTHSDLGPIQELARGFDTMAARLEADEEQRRSLLADVSHELRTPLAVVQGNIEALVDGVHPADPEHLALILEETRVLGRLVDDLRTVALSESGSLPLHPEPTDLALLIADVVRSFGPMAVAAGATIGADDVPAELPLLEVDPIRIREVLSNLTANALRYTPTGGTVSISATVEPGGDWLRTEVQDTGPGLAPGCRRAHLRSLRKVG